MGDGNEDTGATPRPVRPDSLALEAFIAVNRASQDSPEGLTPAQIEAVCDAHCLVCQQTRGQSEHARIFACRRQGCGLRGIDAWLAEAVWLSDLDQSPLLSGPAPIPAHVLTAFNLHIHQAGCATFAIGLSPEGALSRSWLATTLRGLIHGYLIVLIAFTAGDRLDINVLSTNTAGARVLAGQRRNEENDLKRQHARALYRQGWSVNKIHKEINVARSTIKKWTADVLPDTGEGVD